MHMALQGKRFGVMFGAGAGKPLASYVLNRKQKDFNIQAASSSWMMLRMESSAL
jgi:hypothetical protein